MLSYNKYALELPCISMSIGPLHRPSVNYIHFNKNYNTSVSSYRGLEIPCHNLRQSLVEKRKLSYFLKDSEIPRQWGHVGSMVTMKSPSFFDTSIERISKLRMEDCLRWCEPNIKKALSWPLGYPSLKFFYHSFIESYNHRWVDKCDFATQIVRIGGGLGLDDSILFTHSKMIGELALREISYDVLTGENLSKEIAYVQMIRMLIAMTYDEADDCCQSPLFNILSLQREVTSSHLLGNRKWRYVSRDDQIHQLPEGGGMGF
ncbi:NS protein [Capira virus]|uniref:NS protein n=2 Tax=Phlebovirus TaxID=11584 RepID=A0A0F6X2V9_9VIRU|nr:nonstructural protein [Phlebovirus sp. VP-366G]AKF42393.1 NS protein [Capira virus]